jgi:nicotinamidase-related amidase
MSAANVLLKPEECAMLLVDFQAGLGFGVESIPRQLVVNNAVGLARTAVAFKSQSHRHPHRESYAGRILYRSLCTES